MQVGTKAAAKRRRARSDIESSSSSEEEEEEEEDEDEEEQQGGVAEPGQPAVRGEVVGKDDEEGGATCAEEQVEAEGGSEQQQPKDNNATGALPHDPTPLRWVPAEAESRPCSAREPVSASTRAARVSARRGVDAFLARVTASITSDMVSGRPSRSAQLLRSRHAALCRAPSSFAATSTRTRAQVQVAWLGSSVGFQAAQLASPAAAIDTSLGTAPHPAVRAGVTGLSEAFQTPEAVAAAWVGAQAEAEVFAERLGDEGLLDTRSLHRCVPGRDGLPVDCCVRCGW